MARNENDNTNSIDSQYVERDAVEHSGRNASGSDREKYRDDDDVRDPLPPDQRVGTKSDSKSEARGDAREDIGNTAHPQYREGGAQGR